MTYTVEWHKRSRRGKRHVCDAKVQLVNNNNCHTLDDEFVHLCVTHWRS